MSGGSATTGGTVDGDETAAGEGIAAGASGETWNGQSPRYAAAIPYLSAFLGASLLVGPLLYLLNRNNRFVRFHAAQATLLTVVAPVVQVGLLAVGLVLGDALGGGAVSLVLAAPGGVAVLVTFGLFCYLPTTAYQERVVAVPVIGGVARRVA